LAADGGTQIEPELADRSAVDLTRTLLSRGKQTGHLSLRSDDHPDTG
jgi:hypothetical protein